MGYDIAGLQPRPYPLLIFSSGSAMLIKPFMPQFAVTYMAKNPLTEAVLSSNKSSDFISFYM